MKDNPEIFIITIILTAVVMLVLGTTAIICRHVEKMAELGYQEEQIPGSSMSYWRKCL